MVYNITTLKSLSRVLGSPSVLAESAWTRGGSVKYWLLSSVSGIGVNGEVTEECDGAEAVPDGSAAG